MYMSDLCTVRITPRVCQGNKESDFKTNENWIGFIALRSTGHAGPSVSILLTNDVFLPAFDSQPFPISTNNRFVNIDNFIKSNMLIALK